MKLLSQGNESQQLTIQQLSTQRKGSNSSRSPGKSPRSPVNKLSKSLNVKEIREKINKQLHENAKMEQEREKVELREKFTIMDKRVLFLLMSS